MRYHHTKNKGDLGVVKAIADMVDKGWRILLPMSEHDPYDFVAYDGERFLRVQTKYRAIKDGRVYLALQSSWTDRFGVHHTPMDRNAIDVLCIYVPDAGCFYFDPKMVAAKTVVIRFEATRNNQAKGVSWAKDFTEIPSTVRGIRAGEGTGLVGWGWVRQSAESRAA